MSARAAFGQRLRRERERRGLTLDEIAAQSKVSASHFAALERGDLSRWPAGIFGIGFIRSYAHAVGLDPVKTAEEFVRVRSESGPAPATITSLADAAPTSPPVAAPAAVGTDASQGALRLTLESDGIAAGAGPVQATPRRIAAAAAEAVFLAALAAPVWWFRGSTAFWMTLAIAAIVSQLVSAAAGRPWLSTIGPRRSSPSRVVDAPSAPARDRRQIAEPVADRVEAARVDDIAADKRRAPDPRPSPAFRRARRADRRRSQA